MTVDMDVTRFGGSGISQDTIWRLTVEAAIEEGYRIFLERPSGPTRTATRNVEPVDYLPGVDGAPSALRIRVGPTHKTSMSLEGVQRLELSTTTLPDNRVRRRGFTIGDVVAHAEHGFGVVQAFSEIDRESARIRFAGRGVLDVDLNDGCLEPVEREDDDR